MDDLNRVMSDRLRKLEGLIGPIGVVREGESGAAVIDETGQRLDVSGLGWDH